MGHFQGARHEHHQRKVLHVIFAHPVNANLNLKDVTGVLTGAWGGHRRQDEEPHRGHAALNRRRPSCVSSNRAS